VTSLRSAVGQLIRFPSNTTLNISEAAQFLGLGRPISLSNLAGNAASLPPSVRFEQEIVTGAALGGRAAIELKNDGSYTFSGSMRATGFPSFSFRVVAVVKSATGNVLVAATHSGRVFGTDTPGDRENDWSEVGANQNTIKAIRNVWPDISGGSIEVRYSEDLAGVLGGLEDVLKAFAEFIVADIALGPAVAACLVIGSEASNVGISLPGLGGIVGLVAVAGGVCIIGPDAIIPAIVADLAYGEVVDAMVAIRPLHDDEIAFADQVFMGSLDYTRIRVTNLSGKGTHAFTAPTVDGTILLNLGNAHDDPSHAVYPNSSYPCPGQILIHELTHAWQIEHASLSDGYVPGLMCNAIGTVLKTDPYIYGPAGQPWSSFNIEAQGAIVDQWFGGNGRQQGQSSMDETSPYFAYITNNIWLGVP
jgi:hypothetical protein